MPLFGGIPVTGAIARTMTNITNSSSPISMAMVRSKMTVRRKVTMRTEMSLLGFLNMPTVLHNAGIDRLIGADHICDHIDKAILMANAIAEKK